MSNCKIIILLKDELKRKMRMKNQLNVVFDQLDIYDEFSNVMYVAT